MSGIYLNGWRMYVHWVGNVSGGLWGIVVGDKTNGTRATESKRFCTKNNIRIISLERERERRSVGSIESRGHDAIRIADTHQCGLRINMINQQLITHQLIT